MQPNSVVPAATIALDHEPVPPTQIVRGEPTTGAATMEEFGGIEVGVWEMSPGVMNDVETDEMFVVLSGSATVEFANGRPTMHLRPGDLVRLSAGAETVWTVTETLRKVYLVGM